MVLEVKSVNYDLKTFLHENKNKIKGEKKKKEKKNVNPFHIQDDLPKVIFHLMEKTI